MKNRIVMPPVATGFNSPDGFITGQCRAYLRARARGGVGLIIMEATCVQAPVGKAMPQEPALDDDRFIPGLRETVQAIKGEGAAVLVQLHHAGRDTVPQICGGQPVAPSAIPGPSQAAPRELSIPEIEELVTLFAQAAGRAQAAGCDGIELHAGHGYLLAQFLSAHANKRQDEYGGTLEKRARLLMEVIAAIRRRVGRGFLIGCRLNGQELAMREGLAPEEAQQIAVMAEAAGADLLNISIYGYGSQAAMTTPDTPGVFLHLAEGVRKRVRIPVIGVGYVTPELGERAVGEGRVDLVAMGRSLLADPEVPNKLAQGRSEDIVPCIRCLTCMDLVLVRGEPVRCSVNPRLGREQETALFPAARPKRVLVVGGGPGGMEAARTAALRGHRVTLVEREAELGGQLSAASKPPHKGEVGQLRDYLATQLDRLGVEVRLGKEADAALVRRERAEAVIVAAGSRPSVPDIPGIEGAGSLQAVDVLLGRAEAGKRVIILGGEMVGCETALFLARRGRQVTLLRRGPRLLTGMMPFLRRRLLDELRAEGVVTHTGVGYRSIAPGRLNILTQKGEELTLEADSIVLATGARADDRLVNELQGAVPELYTVGDCVAPRRILEAIREGFEATIHL